MLTPWRVVPPAFFRTHCLVVLGLLVLAGLDGSRVGLGREALATLAAASAFSYLGAVAWGMGLHRLGLPLSALTAAACAGAMIAASRPPDPSGGLWTLGASARLASAFLLGSTLSAMLLGHHYLTAPAMSIEPLKRFVRCVAWGLAARAVVAGVGFGPWLAAARATSADPTSSALFLAMRWGMGLLGPAVATWMTWKSVEIRSTQSATGILYIAMTLVLFGELTAMALTRESGLPS